MTKHYISNQLFSSVNKPDLKCVTQIDLFHPASYLLASRYLELAVAKLSSFFFIYIIGICLILQQRNIKASSF